jgi:hypothetical protein
MAFGFPVSLEVAGRRCVVFGAGPVARSRTAALLDAGADFDTWAGKWRAALDHDLIGLVRAGRTGTGPFNAETGVSERAG